MLTLRQTSFVDNGTTSGHKLEAARLARGFGAGLVFADAATRQNLTILSPPLPPHLCGVRPSQRIGFQPRPRLLTLLATRGRYAQTQKKLDVCGQTLRGEKLAYGDAPLLVADTLYDEKQLRDLLSSVPGIVL